MRYFMPVLAGFLVLLLTSGRGHAIVPQVMLRAGEVLVSVEPRRIALRRLDPDRRKLYCGVPRSGWALPRTEKRVKGSAQPGQRLALNLMQASAALLAFDDASARQSIVASLDRWARNDGMSRPDSEPRARVFYNMDRTLMPMIVAFSLVRSDPAADPVRIARIEAWLRTLVDSRRGDERFYKPSLTSSRNNHRYLADSVTMAWGALTGDATLFAKGVQRFRLALEQARADGSLPLETARGKRALYYQRHAIGSLVAIAEMAALQGIDLYTWHNGRGQSLHDLVDFLAAALDKRSLVEAYAPAEQDLGFLEKRGHERHYMAWLEAYSARFGEREATRRLWQAVDAHGYDGSPMLDDYFGSMTTCLFRPIANGGEVSALGNGSGEEG